MRLDDEKMNHDNTSQSCSRAEKKLKETTKAYNDAKLDLEQVRILFICYDQGPQKRTSMFEAKPTVPLRMRKTIAHV